MSWGPRRGRSGAGGGVPDRRVLDEGRYAPISEMAQVKAERGYLGSLLRLTLLAPDIVEAVLDGRQSERTALPRLLAPFPVVWSGQGAAIGAHQSGPTASSAI